MALYKIFNGPMPTTAPFGAVTTGTAIKTLLQIKPFNVVKIVAWGVSFDGSAAAAGIECELIDTGTVFGTVTASVDADVFKFGGGDGAAASVAGLTLGASATGYTCTSEGAITAAKVLDAQFVQPTGPYAWEFSLGREPVIVIGNCCRIRVKAAAAVNAIAWLLIEV
ncbi:MAG: hypothetical protein V4719_10755 [Planctomycetota bacterium]